MKYILQNLRVEIEKGADISDLTIEAVQKKLNKAMVKAQNIRLSKRSVDARKKDDIHYVCSAIFETDSPVNERVLKKMGAVPLAEKKLELTFGDKPLDLRPVIVGMGPCGMFAALILAENGYRPIILERGPSVYERKAEIDAFYKTGILNTCANIQFGAGGAGTFSDGKLVTRINDDRCSYVLERFVQFGAPGEILYNAKPHLGTDNLLGIVDRISQRIEELGGNIYYNTKVESVNLKNNVACSVNTSRGEIPCGALILAVGHSARDTYKTLIDCGYDVVAKPFSVGVRIEHIQKELDEAMYGNMAPYLPPAEYSLSKVVGDRGVYSFCMCPGGEVVAAASEEGGVVTNGMSNYARDGVNANAALAVSVLPKDFGNTPLSAIEFQRKLERAAFSAGGGNYFAPAQTLGAFMSGTCDKSFGKVVPTYMGGNKTQFCDLNRTLPSFVSEMLKVGINDFGRKIRGFDAEYAVLTGVETRTSAPVRILRDVNMLANGFENIYPAGEGAGYAGGITSAAVDGIAVAAKLMSVYRPMLG